MCILERFCEKSAEVTAGGSNGGESDDENDNDEIDDDDNDDDDNDDDDNDDNDGGRQRHRRSSRRDAPYRRRNRSPSYSRSRSPDERRGRGRRGGLPDAASERQLLVLMVLRARHRGRHYYLFSNLFFPFSSFIFNDL